MQARNELLAYMGSAVVTIALLFGLQIWYATYLDAHVVNVHPADAPTDAKLKARREQERAKLSGGKMPIGRAKEELAQRARTSFPSIAPKPSADLSAMAGWMHRPGFKPYEPRKAAAAPAEPGTTPPGELAQPAGADAPGDAAATRSETALATPERPAAGSGTRTEPIVKVPSGSSTTPAVQQ